jgi:hypothetical protein
MKNTHDLNSVLLSKKVGGRNKQETANAGGIGKDIRHQSGHDVYLGDQRFGNGCRWFSRLQMKSIGRSGRFERNICEDRSAGVCKRVRKNNLLEVEDQRYCQSLTGYADISGWHGPCL